MLYVIIWVPKRITKEPGSTFIYPLDNNSCGPTHKPDYRTLLLRYICKNKILNGNNPYMMELSINW